MHVVSQHKPFFISAEKKSKVTRKDLETFAHLAKRAKDFSVVPIDFNPQEGFTVSVLNSILLF